MQPASRHRLRTPSRPPQPSSSSSLAPRPASARVEFSPKKTTPEALRSLEEEWRNRRRGRLQELLKRKEAAAFPTDVAMRPHGLPTSQTNFRGTAQTTQQLPLRAERQPTRSIQVRTRAVSSIKALHSAQRPQTPLPSPPPTPELKQEPARLPAARASLVTPFKDEGRDGRREATRRRRILSSLDGHTQTAKRTIAIDSGAHAIRSGSLPPGEFRLGENTIRVHRRKSGLAKASMTISTRERTIAVLAEGRLLRVWQDGKLQREVRLGEKPELWGEVSDLVDKLKRTTPRVSREGTSGIVRPKVADRLGRLRAAHQTGHAGHPRNHVQR